MLPNSERKIATRAVLLQKGQVTGIKTYTMKKERSHGGRIVMIGIPIPGNRAFIPKQGPIFASSFFKPLQSNGIHHIIVAHYRRTHSCEFHDIGDLLKHVYWRCDFSLYFHNDINILQVNIAEWYSHDVFANTITISDAVQRKITRQI